MSNLFGTGINQVPTNGMLGNMAFQDKAFVSVDKIGIGTTATDTGTANQTLQNYGGAYVSGSVGIGTTNPTSTLDVIGNARISGIITASSFSGNASSANTAGVSTSVIGGIGSITQLQVTGISTFSSGPVFIGAATSTGTASQPLQVTGGAYVSGNLGIGTTNPSSTLDVVGNARISGVVTATSYSGSGTNLTGIVTSIVAGSNITISSSTGQVTINSSSSVTSSVSISTNTTNSNQYVPYASSFGSNTGLGATNTFTFNPSTDNLGIGTTNPTSTLHVVGNARFDSTTIALNAPSVTISDPDIILGLGGTVTNPTDATASSGGIAIASTEGGVGLIDLNVIPAETNPNTYKKFMWFRGGTGSGGLGAGVTDAWLSNYAIGIGSTAVPTGTYLAAGNVHITQNDISGVQNINASGIATAAQLDLTANGTNNDGVLSITGTPASNSRNGLLSVGTLAAGLSDKGLLGNFAANQTDYVQIILQNTNSGTTASTDVIVNNDAGGATANYGDFGINSSGYASTNAFGDPNGTYLYANGGTLAIGTLDARDFRIATGSDAATPVTRMTITGTTGRIGIGTTTPVQPFQIGAGTASVVVDAAGDVGIGTTNPASRLHIGGGTTVAGTAPFEIARGSLLSVIESDTFEYDGVALYHTPNDTTNGHGRSIIPEIQHFRLGADGTAITATTAGAASTAGGSWFGATNRPALISGYTYDFEYHLHYTKATAGTVTFQAAASTGSITEFSAYAVPTNAAQSGGYVQAGTGTTATFTATASITNGGAGVILVKGIVIPGSNMRLNLQVFQSAGTITPKKNSWYKFSVVGIGNTIGNIG